MNPPTANNVLTVAAIDDGDIAEVIALWQRCGSPRAWNDPAADIALARRETNSTVLIGRNGGDLVASVLVGHDGTAAGSITLPSIPSIASRGTAA